MSESLLAKIRILVIEDEDFTRQMICGLLRQLGFRLINEAADGEAGFKELVRTKPLLVLCDVHMQPLDGLGFLAKLRGLSNAVLADTPVIFLTADKQQETVLTAKKLQADGYIVKPVSLQILKQRLDVLMQKRSII
ncbi:response regulator [Ferrovibrio sp.]|uniref:response regulator n=1 Tax=Ferrovibrio sp. TaxID=1917215 RepID=UPI001B744B82|nr:response regulator [Ferrovibrio sp.]MBP7064798.1 response regulator [Ferrovibrio sp.]